MTMNYEACVADSGCILAWGSLGDGSRRSQLDETRSKMETSSKNSVAFIMNSPETVVVQDATIKPTVPSSRSRQVRSPAMDEKRRARECRVDGCENYIINKGLCFRHGGGKKCSAEGCQSSAKHSGLCWKHGGWVKCQMEGCDRRGKSRGLCWSHGGGTKWSHADCSKVAVSNSLCWAHGGGKRCIYKGCKKAAYERNNNYCTLAPWEARSGCQDSERLKWKRGQSRSRRHA